MYIKDVKIWISEDLLEQMDPDRLVWSTRIGYGTKRDPYLSCTVDPVSRVFFFWLEYQKKEPLRSFGDKNIICGDRLDRELRGLEESETNRRQRKGDPMDSTRFVFQDCLRKAGLSADAAHLRESVFWTEEYFLEVQERLQGQVVPHQTPDFLQELVKRQVAPPTELSA